MFNHITVNYLNQNNLFLFYSIALIIYIAYIYQYFNISNLLKYKIKNIILNEDLLKTEISYTLKNPKNAKFYFFPAMWVLIAISIFSHFFFHFESKKWIFDILIIILFVQNYFYYDFIFLIAEEVESSGKSVEEALKEKEWNVFREKKAEGMKIEIVNGLKIATEKEMKSFGFKRDKESEYYLNDSGELFELYKSGRSYRLDKLNLVLSSIFDNLYKEFKINHLGTKYILEAFFVIMTLYLSVIIK